MAELASELRGALRDLGDAGTAEVRRLRRLYSRRLTGEPAAVVFDLAGRLVEAGGLVPRFVAYELVAAHPAAMAEVDERLLRRLGRGLSSWGDVDAFAVCLAGPAWREGRIGDAVVRGWAASPDRWWRRAALVATVPLNQKSRGGRGDAPRTLAVCSLLLADRNAMVVKAMSWALRELAKRKPAPVRAFLRRHDKVIAARVRREVTTKLETGRKVAPRRPAP